MTHTQSTAATPARTVKTDLFAASSAMPTVKAERHQVQTGGFGDPNGVPVKGGSGNGALQVASVGSFDLPAGGGRGNGMGGSRGTQGIVASAGFGNGIAAAGAVRERQATQLQNTAFGAAAVAERQPRAQAPSAPAAMTPAEILTKPQPVYTDEARQRHIEGEVLLDVIFTASGEVRVVRVVRGLGYGLDDAAVKAAARIRFKPAMVAGKPVDSTARIHISFQMA